MMGPASCWHFKDGERRDIESKNAAGILASSNNGEYPSRSRQAGVVSPFDGRLAKPLDLSGQLSAISGLDEELIADCSATFHH